MEFGAERALRDGISPAQFSPTGADAGAVRGGQLGAGFPASEPIVLEPGGEAVLPARKAIGTAVASGVVASLKRFSAEKTRKRGQRLLSWRAEAKFSRRAGCGRNAETIAFQDHGSLRRCIAPHERGRG